jgi:3-hydroxyisobutyrate dehydrogenase
LSLILLVSLVSANPTARTQCRAVEIFVKDLGIVLETGKTERFPLFLAAVAHQLFLTAAAGLGREDDSAVVKVFEQLAGIQVSVKKQY